jgi:hypothetical protein
MRTHRHPLLCATKEAVVSPFVEAAPAKDAAAAPAAGPKTINAKGFIWELNPTTGKYRNTGKKVGAP